MQTKEKKYFRNNLIMIFIFILFFISFSQIKTFFISSEKDKSTPENFLYSINNGIGSFFNFFSNIGEYFSSKKYLLNQIDDLQNQLADQRYSNIIDSSSSVAQDSYSVNPNSKSKNILNRDLPVVAKKIFSDFTSIYDTVLLNKGFSSGVNKGDLVFVYPNFAIGEIDTINPNTSLLSLYSKDKNKIEGVMKVSKNISLDINKVNQNSSSSLSASSSSSSPSIIDIKKINENNILLDVYGNGGGDFIASLPDNLNVATGTIIYLSKDESKILGEVVKIEKEDASFYKTIFIKGYYNTRLNNDYYIAHK